MSIKKNIITVKAIQDLEISIREYEDEYLKPFVSDPPLSAVLQLTRENLERLTQLPMSLKEKRFPGFCPLPAPVVKIVNSSSAPARCLKLVRIFD